MLKVRFSARATFGRVSWLIRKGLVISRRREGINNKFLDATKTFSAAHHLLFFFESILPRWIGMVCAVPRRTHGAVVARL